MTSEFTAMSPENSVRRGMSCKKRSDSNTLYDSGPSDGQLLCACCSILLAADANSSPDVLHSADMSVKAK